MKSLKIISSAFLLILTLTRLFSQTYIAVLPLDNKGVSKTDASILTDRLRSELFQTGKFTVLEREKMQEILTEQGFQLSGCTSDECIVQAGQLIGVEQMVGGSVSKFGNLYTISARIIDVESGKIFRTATFDHEGRMEALLKVGIRSVAGDLAGLVEKKDTPDSQKNQIRITEGQNLRPEIKKLRIGLLVGFQVSKFNRFPVFLAGHHTDKGERIGYNIGGLIKIRISNTFLFQLESYYSLRGAFYESNYNNNVLSEELFTLKYFDFYPAMMIKFLSFGKSGNSFSFVLGPYYSVLLDKKVKADVHQPYLEEQIKHLRDTDYGIHAGINYSIIFQHFSLSFELRLMKGFQDISPDLDENVNMAGFSINTSIFF